jgi:SdpC family antimicrobial peptide
MNKQLLILRRTSGLLMLSLPFLAIVLFSFSSPNSNGERVKAHYSGEELFQGIYFHYGAVVNELSTISRTSILKSSVDLDKNYNELKVRLLKNDPQFFENFKQDILSHSHNTVSDVLRKTSTEVFTLMQSMYQEKLLKRFLDVHNKVSDNSYIETPWVVVVNPFVVVDFPPDVPDQIKLIGVWSTSTGQLPLGPSLLSLAKNGKKTSVDQSKANFAGEMLVNEIVEKL